PSEARHCPVPLCGQVLSNIIFKNDDIIFICFISGSAHLKPGQFSVFRKGGIRIIAFIMKSDVFGFTRLQIKLIDISIGTASVFCTSYFFTAAVDVFAFSIPYIIFISSEWSVRRILGLLCHNFYFGLRLKITIEYVIKISLIKSVPMSVIQT